jgi:hypothetical protein
MTLTASLEGMVDRWLETRQRVIHRLTKGLVSDVKVANRKRAVTTIRDKAASYKELITNMDTTSVSLGGDLKYLTINGQAPSRISQVLTDDIRGLTELGQTYVPDMIAFSKQTHTAFTGVISSGREDIIKQLKDMSARQHPMEKLSRPLTEGGVLTGDMYVTVNIKSKQDVVDKLKAMASAKPPRLKRRNRKEAPDKGNVDITRAEATSLVKCLEQYADLMEKMNADLPKQITSLDYSKGFIKRGAKTNERVANKGIAPLRKLTNKAPLQAVQIMPDIFNHIKQRAKVIIAVLNKATEANVK